ncbi:MAG: hypothetical protein CL477_16275 [Acidobacteria bacterium]|jgi:protein TonB|nr:hypothetical protein [Acidobacteriota bacterium]MDP7479987.1 TonB family protein [Vicinamibacterales bacterium]HJN45468.1 TonB family protein [Vicinamibacterales bacterium]|tara:strand:+ start:3615 stop:4328 length:714 start_codon:yes stop_codon:yes gene_type:complete
MADQLFGEISSPSIRVGTRKWYTVPVSILTHAAVLAVVLIVPLMAADVLPATPTMLSFVAPPPPPPAPPPPPPPSRPAEAQATPIALVDQTAAPIVAPRAIVAETGFDLTKVEGIEGGVSGGVVAGVVGGVLTSPPPPPALDEPLVVGGAITRPERTRSVEPVYPRVAQAARVSGVVILEAVIGPDGRVRDVRVLRSAPLLDRAAIAAVRQWEYTPTLLNGVPVPVVMTVTVTFTLN